MRYRHFIKERGDVINEGPSKCKGFTMAIEEIDDVQFIAIAYCSKKDSFCKRTGRQIAQGRLDKLLKKSGHVSKALTNG